MNFGNPNFLSEIKRISSDEIWITWNTSRLIKYNLLTRKIFLINFSENHIKKANTIIDNLDQSSTQLENSLELILDYSKTIKNKIKYIGYLDEVEVLLDMRKRNPENYKLKRYLGITYIFYQETQSYFIKVIRYDNYHKEWLVGGYSEEEITEQNRIELIQAIS